MNKVYWYIYIYWILLVGGIPTPLKIKGPDNPTYQFLLMITKQMRKWDGNGRKEKRWCKTGWVKEPCVTVLRVQVCVHKRVKELYVTKLCVKDCVCVKEMYVTKFCVKELCVKELCAYIVASAVAFVVRSCCYWFCHCCCCCCFVKPLKTKAGSVFDPRIHPKCWSITRKAAANSSLALHLCSASIREKMQRYATAVAKWWQGDKFPLQLRH